MSGKKKAKDAGHFKTVKLKVGGMTCHSCEKVIEKAVKSIDGVHQVKADYGKGEGVVEYDPNKTSLDKISDSVNEKGYTCSCDYDAPKGIKSSIVSILLVIIAVLIGAYILFGGFDFQLPSLDQNASIALVFIIGLLTGFHCVAMCGGFVVSYASRDALKHRGFNIKSHLAYGFGKTLSYAIIGALFGLVGSIITFTPFIRGVAAILAGVFLALFGLNMLGIFGWFRRFRLKTPSFVGNVESRSPLVIGLLNGLMIACGPLQALYIFAAASGSPFYGGLYLAVFGLGTLPVLLGFGILTSVISSKLTLKIVKYSGVIVILLGLVMVNRGIALTGINFGFTQSDGGNAAVGDLGIKIINGSQFIYMNVTGSGWQPDRFVLKKGVPVKWVIDGQEITSCNKAIQVPKLGLSFDIKPGLQTIEFTPTESGTIPWSCWMGMIPGTFIVKDDVNASNLAQIKQDLTSVTLAKSGGCGGGCGGGGCGGGGGGCGGGGVNYGQ